MLCAIVPVADVELARLAFTDPVTGIANRHALDRDLDHALVRSGRCVGLLHVDLTGSRRSTTASAIVPATPSGKASAPASATRCVRTTQSRASAATSSSSR